MNLFIKNEKKKIFNVNNFPLNDSFQNIRNSCSRILFPGSRTRLTISSKILIDNILPNE